MCRPQPPQAPTTGISNVPGISIPLGSSPGIISSGGRMREWVVKGRRKEGDIVE